MLAFVWVDICLLHIKLLHRSTIRQSYSDCMSHLYMLYVGGYWVVTIHCIGALYHGQHIISLHTDLYSVQAPYHASMNYCQG